MQSERTKAPHNPSDPLVMSYVLQLIGEVSRSRSGPSLVHESVTNMDASEHDGSGYLAHLAHQLPFPTHLSLPETYTWKAMFACCISGTLYTSVHESFLLFFYEGIYFLPRCKTESVCLFHRKPQIHRTQGTCDCAVVCEISTAMAALPLVVLSAVCISPGNTKIVLREVQSHFV